VELGRDEWPQTKEQLKIINDNSKVHDLLDLKEKIKGNAQNEATEKANQAKIEEFSKLIERKKAAILELEKIINQTSPSEPTKPTEPSPNSNNNTPSQSEETTNPVANNNENSSQNIQEIANSTLDESKQKWKTEIKELFARYGVKSSELASSLWENQTSWEQYLVSLSTSQSVSEFAKKMKVAIMKKSGENQQKLLSDEVSLETVHEQAKQQIQEIIQQYSGILEKLDKSVWNREKDWQTHLEKLSTKEQKLAFVRQMREAIISRNKQKGKENTSPANSPKFPWKVVIPAVLIVGIVGFVLVLKRIRQKKVNEKKKK
jgi:hypothetical protein